MLVTAAVAHERKNPLSIEELELGPLFPDEVRVRMVAAGICHTDTVARDGVYPVPLPAVLGHEGAGVVEEVGDRVAGIRPGDQVVLGPAYCGSCEMCRSGEPMYCHRAFAATFACRRADGSTAFTDPDTGDPVGSHFFGQSSFAEYANVTATSVTVVDPDVPLEVLAPLGCGLATGAGAVLNEMRPRPGASIAVLGTGAVGFGALMATAAAGCTPIICVDVHPSRLELARELGATDTIDASSADTKAEIMRITGKRGVDFAIDTTASPAVLRTGAEVLATRGKLVAVGAAAPGTEVSFEIGASLAKGWTFTTVIEGSAVPQVLIRQLVALWRAGRFPVERLVRPYRLEQINNALADAAGGAVIKPVIVY